MRLSILLAALALTASASAQKPAAVGADASSRARASTKGSDSAEAPRPAVVEPLAPVAVDLPTLLGPAPTDWAAQGPMPLVEYFERPNHGVMYYGALAATGAVLVVFANVFL